MDEIQKSFRKLAPSEQAWVNEIFAKLRSGNVAGLNLKKLRGWDDIYRVRKGDIRVIYQKKDAGIVLLFIGRRNESTYEL